MFEDLGDEVRDGGVQGAGEEGGPGAEGDAFVFWGREGGVGRL